MKHTFRFLFGAVIGVALGYALTLLVPPASLARRRNGSRRQPAGKRDSGS